MSSTVTSLKLSSGSLMPILGLGTWKSAPGEVTKAVKNAFRLGYRHIDCAALYDNEAEVGVAIDYAIRELKISREDIFITSKLWNTKHSAQDVEPALRRTLKDLGLKYIDLYLIHSPMGFEAGDDHFPTNDDGTFRFDEETHPTDVWFSMEKLVGKGLAKNIGVSNFNSVQLQDILDRGTIKPVLNQIELHPYLNQQKLVDYCLERGLQVTAYSPFGSPDRPWATPDDVKVLDNPELKKIGDKYEKSPAQVILRWNIQRKVSVIPKSVNSSRIETNFQVFDFELKEEDMKQIASLSRNDRVLDLKEKFEGHKHYPFSIEF